MEAALGGRDVLTAVLATTGEHAWFARQTCVAFRDHCRARRPSDEWISGAVERVQLAYRPRNMFGYAAEAGDVPFLQWALDTATELGDPEWRAKLRHNICVNAAHGGRLEVLGWAESHDLAPADLLDDVMDSAGSGGQRQVIQWARDRGAAWSAHVCSLAACSGHAALLEWLAAEGCPMWPAVGAAAEFGHLGILEWLATVVDVDHERVVSLAAHNGHQPVVEWAWPRCECRLFNISYHRGMPFGPVQCAASRGHLQTLVWLRDNGAEWDARVVREEARVGAEHQCNAWCHTGWPCIALGRRAACQAVIDWLDQG